MLLRKRVLLFLLVGMIGLLFLGCSKEMQGKDSIILKIQFGPDEAFINAFIKPAEERFPHITFEHVEGNLEELIAANNAPDILWFWDLGWLKYAAELEMTYDMTELIKKTGFDLSRYDPNHLAEWQIYSGDELWVLPISTDRFALIYNRDIFDQFGVDYPKDGMTWEEVIELARKVTGERNGVEYQGLYMPKAGAPIFWTAGPLIDPETDEPLWTENETVRTYFELYKQNYSIPGNPYIPEHWEAGGWPELFEQGRLAMAAHWFFMPSEDAQINWDIVTYPEPENGVLAGGWAIGISATSEHKEEVMKVFDFWLSDEQILNNSFIGGPLSLPFQHLYDNGKAIEKVLETDSHIWEGRNMNALFSLPVATPMKKISEFQNDDVINNALYEYVHGDQIDLNTLMREKYEEEVARIKDEKAKK